jgi:hypothetical protein
MSLNIENEETPRSTNLTAVLEHRQPSYSTVTDFARFRG